MVDELLSREVTTDAGRVTEKVMVAFSAATIYHLDRITYHGETFEVVSEPTTEYLLGVAAYKKLNLVMIT